MKIKALSVAIILIFALLLGSCAMPLGASVLSFSTTITAGEYAEFLRTRAEHYPISDEFIERYQQKSGGYIDLAGDVGVDVDKEIHSPNQKWHFFTSYFDPSVESGSISLTDSAESRIYKKLLCPELLLWMYEASNVEPEKVKAAQLVAMEGKERGTHISTTASNMRKCVLGTILSRA